MKKILLVFLALLCISATFISTGNGSFTDNSLWSPTPNNGDFKNTQNTFIVDVGDTMTVDERIGSLNIDVRGVLIFNTDQVTVTDTLFIRDGGEVQMNGFDVDLGTAEIVLENGGNIDVSTGGSLLNNNGYLPVTLTHFDFDVEGRTMDVRWTTEIEFNNYSFALYRVTNGNEMLVYDVLGQGTTYETTHYRYKDELFVVTPNDEISYRLVQMDFDGDTEVFETIPKVLKPVVSRDPIILKIYPNPTTEQVNVRFYVPHEGKATIRLFAIHGVLVGEYTDYVFYGTTEFTNINLNRLSSMRIMCILEFNNKKDVEIFTVKNER